MANFHASDMIMADH